MFEKVILRKSENQESLTIGEIAEALLFYQNIHIILDLRILQDLIKSLGFEGLLSLLSRTNISAVYIEEILGTMTETYAQGAVQLHSFQSIFISGHKDLAQPLNSKTERLIYGLTSAGFDKNKTKRFVEKFRQIVPFKKYSDDYYVPGGIVKAAIIDLENAEFTHEAIRLILSSIPGANQDFKDFKFEVMPNPKGFYVFTDIDFKAINLRRISLPDNPGDLTKANLVTELLSARADTSLAAHYGGEFYTSNVSSEIIKLRYKELLQRIDFEKEQLEQWKEIVIPDNFSLKEIINSHQKSFDDFLKLLDKSQKFRDFVQGVNPDENLVNSYFKEVTAPSWSEKFPTKTLRYVLGGIIEANFPSAGKVLSFADTFLLDKILQGWRPSHFVNKRLKPFLGKD